MQFKMNIRTFFSVHIYRVYVQSSALMMSGHFRKITLICVKLNKKSVN